MAEKRRGLGRGIGALIPANQQEKPCRPIDVFFTSPDKNAADSPVRDLSTDIARSDTSQQKKLASSTTASTKKASNSSNISAGVNRSENTQSTKPYKNVSRETLTMIKSDRVHISNNKKETAHAQSGMDKGVISGESKESFVQTSEKIPSANSEKDIQKDVSRETSPIPAESSGSQDSGVRDVSNAELVPVPGATFGELIVTEIVPNTKQPRQVFDEDDLQELSDSIKEVGILQPIVVRPLSQPLADAPDARYELIMGERRWRATQRAGLHTIPAIVRYTEDSDLLRDALLENLHRTQLNALEEAAAYQQLLDDFQITQEQLSKKIARSRPQISNTLRLLKLPPLVQRRVAAGVLSAGHARALLGLSDPAAMERLAQRIVAEGLSVRSVEEIVALGGEETKKERSARTYQYKEEMDSLARRLGDQLDTRVKVQMGSKKGRISVEFAGIEDLNRILSVLGNDPINIE